MDKTLSHASRSISRLNQLKFVFCILSICFESWSPEIKVLRSLNFFEITFFLFVYFYGLIMIATNLCPNFVVGANINTVSCAQMIIVSNVIFAHWTKTELLFEYLTPIIIGNSP